MIQMHSDANIAKHRIDQRKRLIDSYHVDNQEVTDKMKDLLKKAISVDTFQEKYPDAQYEMFSAGAVEKFKADFADEVTKGADSDTLEKALEGLEAVVVTKDSEIALFYVRKKAEAIQE